MSDEYYLFRGCLIPSRLPYLESSSRFVLDKIDIRYDDLPGETCCVEPIGLRSMAKDTWLVSAARLLSIAEENGRDIIALCNGCYMSLKEAKHALDDPMVRNEVNEVLKNIGRKYDGSVEVRHFVSVVRSQGEERIRSLITAPMTRLKLAAHPGCHMVRPSGVLKIDRHFRPEVLTELASWTGAEVVFTEAWPKCCGGGLAGIDDPLSAKILGSAVVELKGSGADHILTPCPFCFIQFDLKQKELPVLFLSELLAMAFGAEPQKIGLNYHRIKPSI